MPTPSPRFFCRSRLRLPSLLPVALAAAALSSGCASQQIAQQADREALLAELESRGLDPNEVLLPYGLTDRMRDWVHERIPSTTPAAEKLERLSHLLLTSERMKLEYEWGYTGTAIEVFENRKANCLAFTNLFLGMARELGVEVYFVTVPRVESFRKDGDLVVVSDHIAVGYGIEVDRTVFDFAELPTEEPRFVQRISDVRAIALFYSNRGAESLQAGLEKSAVEWLRTSLQLEPDLARTWANLGVALRRTGQLDAAEEAYRKAIELDPALYSAYHNLASLLRVQDRDGEAEELEDVLAESPHRNPFTYLVLGDISIERGRVDEARRFYQKAVNLGRDSAECYAAMGMLAAKTGDLRTARRMLKRAEKIDPEETRTAALSQRLAEMRADQG